MSPVASSSSSFPHPHSTYDEHSFLSPLDFLLPGYHPTLGFSQPVSHDQLQFNDKGRMMPFVETQAQRRERVAFLRKREKSRRVSAWIVEASQHPTPPTTTSLEDNGIDLPASRRPEPIAEEEESESYMIYNASAFTSNNIRTHNSNSNWSSAFLSSQRAPRRSTTSSNINSSASSLGSRSPSRHSSRGSLSSISEEEEGEEGEGEGRVRFKLP